MNMTAHREVILQESVVREPLNRRGAAAHVARGAEAERERVRKALHDGLGQLLTSISFLAGSLRQKLAAQQLPEASEAEDIIALTRQAINETQTLVREDIPLTRS
jgi:signal transduction histidine kinase